MIILGSNVKSQSFKQWELAQLNDALLKTSLNGDKFLWKVPCSELILCIESIQFIFQTFREFMSMIGW